MASYPTNPAARAPASAGNTPLARKHLYAGADGGIMSRGLAFTQAEVRRAIKGVQSAGLRVCRVTVGPDGSIALDSMEQSIDSPYTAPATSTPWDDV